MQSILTSVVKSPLARELADRDAHQLRDIGLVRAADGALCLWDDPSVKVAPPARRLKRGLSWGRSLLASLLPSRGLKTAR